MYVNRFTHLRVLVVVFIEAPS